MNSNPTRSAEAERRTREDSQKQLYTLLEEVHYESLNGDHGGDNPDAIRLAFTIAKSASFNYVLAAKTEKQTKWIIGLTFGLGLLTTGLLIATMVLLVIARHTDEQIRDIREIAKSQRNQKENTDTSTPEVNRGGSPPIRK
jgi:hypothetical protein